MATRNIVIAPCGNKSRLFKEAWLKQPGEKNFDLCLLFYHEQVLQPELYKEADYFFHLKGFKYHMIYELLVSLRPEWLQQYDYFYFLDDDIEIDTRQISNLFALSRAMNVHISQAALTRDSFCSWPIFKQQQGSFCRFVGQIEVMAPLFSAEALQLCMPSFIANRSSWGVDAVWSKILGYPEDKLVVFDTVLMRHTQPVGGGELYQKIGVDPHTDWRNITSQYQAKKQNYREYGRLQLVNKRHHRLYYFVYRWKEFWAKRKQDWNDYDLPSRIKSRRAKIWRKIKFVSVP